MSGHSLVRVCHVSLHEGGGGGAIAAQRIHQALVRKGGDAGVVSRLRVIFEQTADPTVLGGPAEGVNPFWQRLQPRFTAWAKRGFRSSNPITHSIAWPSTGFGRELNRSAADLLHLHWLGDQTLSIEEIGALRRPVVWTLHDQWAFCGAEHYQPPMENPPARFEQGYHRGNRPPGERGPDLCRSTWERKLRSWIRPITIACPSLWLADCVRRSALMADWPIHVIPHPIDTEFWKPIGRDHARAALDLPQEGAVVVFGAMGGTQVPHKGGDLLVEALQDLRANSDESGAPDLRLVVFGQAAPRHAVPLGFPTHYFDIVRDPISLRLLYNAADVVVVPSRLEAFGQVALEAQACGVAVAAFATGGLLDIVADRRSGALAEPFDPRSLAAAIRWVLEDPLRAEGLGAEGRRRVETLCAEAVVARHYAHVYRGLMER